MFKQWQNWHFDNLATQKVVLLMAYKWSINTGQLKKTKNKYRVYLEFLESICYDSFYCLLMLLLHFC